MSAAEENELIETIIWSDDDYKLEEFVARFKLPQVVRVEVGFCAVDERTGLASGQVIMLHCVRKTKKLICKTPLKHSVLIPLDCPLGVLVHPLADECEYTKVSARQLPSLRAKYDHIKYVFALEGFLNLKCPKETLEIGEIYELGDVDARDCSVMCKNVATGKMVSIKPDSNVLFAPLLDCRRHTLAEVEEMFGFPVQVYFLNKNSVARTSSGTTSSMLVSKLDTVTVVGEIAQAVVISTTLGSGADNVYLKIPSVLPVEVVVAQGFIPGKEHNQRIVETLEKQFNRTALDSSQNLDVYEDFDAATKTIHEISFKQPSDEIKSKEFDYEPAPTLAPKRVGRNETSPQVSTRQGPPVSTKPRPIATPKPSPKPVPKPKPKPGQSTAPKRSSERKSSTMPRMDKSPKTKLPVADEQSYVEFSKEAWPNTSRKSDTLEGQHIYELPYTESTVAPEPVPASVHTVCPPRGDGQDTVRAECPPDLSDFSVSQISELLSKLNMACYKELFHREMIDGEMLKGLDQECLKSLGVNAFHVKKLMKFIDGWRPNV